tara:strand:- start:142 stop:309 length:168 start_codon:yes stop_codon:yes gene_type:complete
MSEYPMAKKLLVFLIEVKGIEDNVINNIIPEMELFDIQLSMFNPYYMDRIENKEL